ncbi:MULTISPECIES: MFS transporter [Providencia]|uniref:MFS transporter n=1 Tax=Providencia hangzhouensis TaxID=3031799 RepID=A0ABY9ZE96_9GAMM|nr:MULTISPECIES: MFS transporter [Providencia]MBN6365355.1 MFS transporter [Providencia rettgeri]WNK25724.1 MFS transporter [Providencia hangzhouensis]
MKWKYRFGVSLGNMLEHYDIAVFAAISVYLIKELNKLNIENAPEIIWGIFALRYILRPFGGYVIGRFADKSGKKSALILTSMVTGFATLLMALLPIELLGKYTPIIILMLQSALCFSFAGEYPSLINYLLYNCPENERSRISALTAISSLLGFTMAFLVIYILENTLTIKEMEDIGWRIPLLLGLINIFISFWFRSRLPDQPTIAIEQRKVEMRRVLSIFIVAIPATVTFYTQNISWSLILEYLPLGENKKYYSLLSSLLLLISVFVCSWITDKVSSPVKVFNIGVTALIVLSIPLYYMMTLGEVWLIILSQIIMTIYIAMIWCNSAVILVQASGGKVSTLGVGFNSTAVIFGGLTPLVINQLLGLGMVYVGVFLCCCGFVFLLNWKVNKIANKVTS